MLRIGLTGGISSGKSTALARFEQLGARIVDHDDLARQAVQPGSAALADIAREFGDRLIVHGSLDRRALGDIVFNDEAARERLNAITHPYIQSLAQAADRKAMRERVPVIVHAIPLLVETDQARRFDLVVTVAAPVEVRIRRLVEDRDFTEQQAAARIAAQATDEDRALHADVVLDGAGTVGELNKQVDAFWRGHVPVSGRPRSVKG